MNDGMNSGPHRGGGGSQPLLRFPADNRDDSQDVHQRRTLLLGTSDSNAAYEYNADWQYVRTHLANERTFLAWVRTSLSLFGIGYGILKLETAAAPDDLPWYDALVAMIFALAGLASFVLGAQRFWRVRTGLSYPKKPFIFKRIGIRYMILTLMLCLVAGIIRAIVCIFWV